MSPGVQDPTVCPSTPGSHGRSLTPSLSTHPRGRYSPFYRSPTSPRDPSGSPHTNPLNGVSPVGTRTVPLPDRDRRVTVLKTPPGSGLAWVLHRVSSTHRPSTREVSMGGRSAGGVPPEGRHRLSSTAPSVPSGPRGCVWPTVDPSSSPGRLGDSERSPTLSVSGPGRRSDPRPLNRPSRRELGT